MGKKGKGFHASMLTWQTLIQRDTNFWQRSHFQGNGVGPLSYEERVKSSFPRLLMSAIVGAEFPNELISD